MKMLWTIYGIGLTSLFLFLPQEKKLEESVERGKEIYTDFCVTCHLPNGKGVENAFPPLAGSDYLLNKREESIKAIKFGQNGEITVNGVTYSNTMTPMGLTDEEVADVMNYILNTWENSSEEMVTAEEVSEIEK